MKRRVLDWEQDFYFGNKIFVIETILKESTSEIIPRTGKFLNLRKRTY